MRVRKGFKIIISIILGILIISSLSLYIGRRTLSKIYIDTNSFEGLNPSLIIPHSNVLWVDNPTFEAPIDPWFSTIEGDSSDAITSTSPNQANIHVIGETYEQEVLLSSATISNWEAFNKSDLALEPQRGDTGSPPYFAGPYYGLDSDGAWCTHRWWEGESGGQPKNTPEMHWRTNVSLPVDMSDFIITEVNFSAIINASVDTYIDTPNDSDARSGVSINQFELYDYAQFYVELTTPDIDELNTYRIAFNQTRMLGNEGLSLYDIEGLIGAYEQQAIIDALTNVLAADPGHDNFTVVIGIYMYCEDNNSGTDLDDWTEMRFKNLNLTFSYVKKVDQFTAVSWSQQLDAINGSNVRVTAADLNFKFKIDQNWTDASQNSQIRVYINDRKYEQAISLIDYVYSPDFQEARIDGFDILSKVLPYEEFNLTIQVFLAEDFGLEQDITISITDVFLYISYTETFADIFSEPWVSTALLTLVSAAAIALGGYFIAYQRILKYPRPVRKVRKFKRTLNKSSVPDVVIVSRDIAFKRSYNRELGSASKSLRLKASGPRVSKVVDKFRKKTEPVAETKVDSSELINTSLEKKSELDKIVDKSLDK
ncbi:MAG: hypothetical protein ACW98X_12915 [Promethearchaeota archaeon]|jgi:hypothetical protein